MSGGPSVSVFSVVKGYRPKPSGRAALQWSFSGVSPHCSTAMLTQRESQLLVQQGGSMLHTSAQHAAFAQPLAACGALQGSPVPQLGGGPR